MVTKNNQESKVAKLNYCPFIKIKNKVFILQLFLWKGTHMTALINIAILLEIFKYKKNILKRHVE